MESMRYLDFDLQIERAAQGYRVQVNCPAGQATHTFRLPFSDLELENFLLRLGHSPRGVRRADSPEVDAAKTFGARLFEAVFGDDVRSCLRSSLDEASRQDAGLRIRLRLNDTPELANLPWEYLYNPALNRFLALSATTPLVRYLELPERIRPLSTAPPLRVLALIASPKNHPPLDVEREWGKLNQALGDLVQRGLVAVERLQPATFPALRQRLRRGNYHVLHVVGHGAFDPSIQDGVLVLEDDEGLGHRVSGQDLGILLHDHRALRLAILNACEGARGATDDPFAGTAQSLVQQGVPAVIAMQFEVTDEAAITLAHEFYSAIADGFSVDAALTEARRAIFTESRGVEWGTPVLYMRTPDGQIFDVARAAQPAAPQLDARPAFAPPIAAAASAAPPLAAPPRRGRWLAIGALAVVALSAAAAFALISNGGQPSPAIAQATGVSTAAATAGSASSPAAQTSAPTQASTPATRLTSVVAAAATSAPTSAPAASATPRPTRRAAPTNTRVPPTETAAPPTNTPVPPTDTPVPPISGTCLAGFVWRLAGPNDRACVTVDSREQAQAENDAAESRRVVAAYGPETCQQGYVWRNAFAEDYVCVTSDVHGQTQADNDAAESRRDPNGAYGPYTCIGGFVWRVARAEDLVCVTPETRAQVERDNAAAASRKLLQNGPDTCADGYVWRAAFDDDHVCVTPDRRAQVQRENGLAPSRTVP